MSDEMKFEIVSRDAATGARAGLLHTPHGIIETPCFMPVGTAATVKGVTQEQLEQLGAQIILANTYHLYLRPGQEIVREMGGLHGFMSWPRPILTDSGGYQVMSLRGLGRVTEDGVHFRSHLDGSSHFLSPERAVEIQMALRPDTMMTLDECLEYPASRENLHRAMKLTGRWARRAKEHFEKLRCFEEEKAESRMHPALFGIVQGGTDMSLRRESAENTMEIGFAGYALGGLSVGEPKSETYDVTESTAALLPQDRPRYLMGVGTPEDLLECVARGIDMFDCVMPTRNARNGSVFTSQGKLVVKNARYARDETPLDRACECSVCRRYSRGYIRHLFMAHEILGATLATLHNLHFYLDTMRKFRHAIISGGFEKYFSRVRAGR
ncbi:MAG TPA: tRNA guanosine(34) transglycosylase Tgt [Terriglobia bacterium]|nr:tRNA guanosine(34) transglycosylase Tgt [Terriglobia bacterium]